MKDIIGRDLKINDPVAFRYGASKKQPMHTGRIKRFTKVQASVEWTDDRGRLCQMFVPGHQIVLLPEDDYIMHCLQKH